MDWFRVYSSILDKPNVCGLPPDVLGYWLLFMAVANRSSPRGTIPANPTELGWAIHRDPTEVEKMRDRLIQAGLLEWEGETLRFHKWNLYQPPSTERANASKGNKKANPQHPATPSNKRQHLATDATQEREREERELRIDPQDGNNQQHPATSGNIELDGPVGSNSAKAVRETLFTAESLFPLTNVRILARDWLGITTAARVIAALHATAAKDPPIKNPAPYAKSLIDDPTFPQARKNGPPPKQDGPTPPSRLPEFDPKKITEEWRKGPA